MMMMTAGYLWAEVHGGEETESCYRGARWHGGVNYRTEAL